MHFHRNNSEIIESITNESLVHLTRVIARFATTQEIHRLSGQYNMMNITVLQRYLSNWRANDPFYDM